MDNDVVKKLIVLRHNCKEHKDESGLGYQSANCCSLSVAPLDLILLISAPVVFKVQNGASSYPIYYIPGPVYLPLKTYKALVHLSIRK